MLRGKRKSYIPKSLEYGVWYNFITPFDWQYFKIKKNSKYVSIYDFMNDKKPQYTFTRKRFLKEILLWVKAPPTPVKHKEF